MTDPRALVIFDGECALCNGFVAWLIRHDREASFLIAGSNGEVGRAALAAARLETSIAASTLVVWDGRAHLRSDAVARIAAGLPWPWRIASFIRAFPRRWRDGVYRCVAARRPRMEAEDPSCGVPPRELVQAWRDRLATLADVDALRAAP